MNPADVRPTTDVPADASHVGKVPYLYVTGASFSGSTLLAFLLNAHPRMMSISEVAGLDSDVRRAQLGTYNCSCGELLLECPFYLELEKRVRALGSTFSIRDWRTDFRLSRSRALNGLLVRSLRSTFLDGIRDAAVPLLPRYKRAIREIAVRNLNIAKAALAITGTKVFVDAQKEPRRIKFLSEIEELDLRVVHLVRDVRGGAASYMKHSPRHDSARAVRAWLTTNMDADRARRFVSEDRWLLIRYDELCRDYQGTVDRIAEFVGVDRAQVSEDFRQTEHHVVGNQMRLRADNKIRLDESWKKRLSSEHLEVIERVGGRGNRHFGFEWP